jgi:hypothetical protein
VPARIPALHCLPQYHLGVLKRTELASRGRYEILCLVGWVLAVRLIWSAWVVVTGSIDLWSGGTQLRGANLWQRIVVPDLDGPEFLGDGTVGPPVHQADLD